MSWSWAAVQSRADEAATIWDKKGSIGWSLRNAIGEAADGFLYDPEAKKADQLAHILDKVNSPEAKNALEQAIGLKKSSWFDKLKAGIEEEQAMLGSAAFDAYMEEEPKEINVKKEPLVDAMDLDAYEEPAVSSSAQAALSFLDGLAASIKQQ
jgi:hypothetical protein